LVEVVIDDQDHTGKWLRRGHVLAAVSSLAKPVQGCKSRKLGALRYRATASPDFVARWFPDGVTLAAATAAPSLVFDHNDRLQELWIRRQLRRDVMLPAHRLPSSQAFVSASVAGLGWGMNPLPLVRDHLAAGRLVELVPDRPLDVMLYWQVANLPIPSLQALTRQVLAVSPATLLQ
jgi:LysR family transcriptional regulator (chromosome initiation inhibitor)